MRKRKKGRSKAFREKFGHTPLAIGENIPWGGKQRLIGTGAHGALPIMEEVRAEAKRRDVELTVVPTLEACRLLENLLARDVHAILHASC